MTDWILPQLSYYGATLLFITTFLSCIAMPIPASLVMLASGAFVAAGDLPFSTAVAAALSGAILGDQAGYGIGRWGSGWLDQYLAKQPRSARLMQKAQVQINRYGGPGVFFSRWLVSPLGPYANFVAGATRLRWLRFTIWGAAGEVVWVFIYITLGTAFTSNIGLVAELASDISGLLAGLAVTALLAFWLRHAMRARRLGRRRRPSALGKPR